MIEVLMLFRDLLLLLVVIEGFFVKKYMILN